MNHTFECNTSRGEFRQKKIGLRFNTVTIMTMHWYKLKNTMVRNFFNVCVLEMVESRRHEHLECTYTEGL